jgi:hypothetical protein
MILKVLKELEWIDDGRDTISCPSCRNKHPNERESDLRFARNYPGIMKDAAGWPENEPRYALSNYGHEEGCELAAAIRITEMIEKLVLRTETSRLGRDTLVTIVASLRAERQKGGYVVEPLTLGWFCPDKAECGVFNTDEKEFLTECRACRSARPRVEEIVV